MTAVSFSMTAVIDLSSRLAVLALLEVCPHRGMVTYLLRATFIVEAAAHDPPLAGREDVVEEALLPAYNVRRVPHVRALDCA